MHTRLMKVLFVAAAFVGTLCWAAPSQASIIAVDSTSGLEGLGSFTGTFEYDAASFQLTITLTNTSDAANGGLITGFVFNIDSQDSSASATLSSASHAFTGVSNHPAPPFGTFTAGAALDGNWAGGGSPHLGIGVGDTGTFIFDISAADAMALTASSFLGAGDGSGFIVRFRGFEDGGSDKVPGIPGETIIPGPSVLALLAMGLLGARSRRRLA